MRTITALYALRGSAYQIAANRGEGPASAWLALTKLFIQPKRNWQLPGAQRVGWKRGELVEVLQAKSVAEAQVELGDVAYYLAQTPLAFLLWLFPQPVLNSAVVKFQHRAFPQRVNPA